MPSPGAVTWGSVKREACYIWAIRASVTVRGDGVTIPDAPPLRAQQTHRRQIEKLTAIIFGLFISSFRAVRCL